MPGPANVYRALVLSVVKHDYLPNAVAAHPRFRLVAVEDCAAFFSALTYRCDGDDGLVVAVRMKSEDDAVEELVFRFRRNR